MANPLIDILLGLGIGVPQDFELPTWDTLPPDFIDPGFRRPGPRVPRTIPTPYGDIPYGHDPGFRPPPHPPRTIDTPYGPIPIPRDRSGPRGWDKGPYRYKRTLSRVTRGGVMVDEEGNPLTDEFGEIPRQSIEMRDGVPTLIDRAPTLIDRLMGER
jgi:hypothetical protein